VGPVRRLESIWLGTVPYTEAWGLQRRLAAARAAGQIGDCVLLLEHPPVYTLGRNTETAHLGGGAEALRALGADCLEVDRGGSVTFHGPGQLVGYPILCLADHFPLGGDPERGDVIAYVRGLEEALIRTAAAFDVSATRRPGYTGAWVGMEKLAAIGVKLASGVTQHGVALNVATDLTWFSLVTPCGIADAGVTSLERLGATGLTPAAAAPRFASALGAVLTVAVEPAGPGLRRLMGAAPEKAGLIPRSASSAAAGGTAATSLIPSASGG
jgi:lipoyl(octanoyl) transferase